MIKRKKTPCDYLKKLNENKSLDLELPWKISRNSKLQNKIVPPPFKNV
jgi:hypothetical protein